VDDNSKYFEWRRKLSEKHPELEFIRLSGPTVDLKSFRETYCDECPLYWGRLAKHKEPLCDRQPFKPECEETIRKHDDVVREALLLLQNVRRVV